MSATPSRRTGELIAVGRIVGAHGIRGELKVEVLTDYPERFDPGAKLLLLPPRGGIEERKVSACREHKKFLLLLIEGVDDRTAAEELRGGYFKIPIEEIRPLPRGDFYRFQLLGLEAVTEEGEILGTVEEVMPTGGNLVLVVRDGEREVLLPYIDDVVREVDLEAGKIVVHLLEGLL